jgi:hypothetical protein
MRMAFHRMINPMITRYTETMGFMMLLGISESMYAQ